jgi:hypothetical protein
MMPRAPRQPVDLQAVTRDIRFRCSRAAADLDQIAQQQDPIFTDPRQVMLELVLVEHQVEAAIHAMRKAFWPMP